jgi:hypothetical protein
MEERKIFSVAALFDTADDITQAVKDTNEAGYTKYDVNTPYPVHGMEKVMKLKPSYLGWITFAIGLGGVTFAVLFMSWASIIDYPLVIGGKPFFSWPAFVPVAFEVTVLSASVGTVVVMIALFFKFPHNSHALLETNYMKKVSADKFGINISVIDPLFNEAKIKEFFAKLGGKDIETIYEEPFPKDIKMFDKRFIGVLAVTALVTAGATYLTLNKLMYIQPFSWMSEQDKGLPQSKSEVFADGFTMRQPVEGSVSREFIPYEYKGLKDSAIINLSNSLPYSKQVLETGKARFDTYCSPCHGYFGKGDTRLRDQFPKPPTLHSDKVRNWADGNIYHVITNGQNIMPSYEKQISRDDRWAIVHYIRVLQRSQNAKESDFESSK